MNIIKYFGGKGLMYKNILNQFPDKNTYNTYIEPFGGAYSVGLHLTSIPQVEIYNDLENNVYTLFKVLNDEKLFTEFKTLCDLCLFNEDLRREYYNELKTNNTLTDIYRAFYFYYVNRTSHSGNGGITINSTIRRDMSKSTSDLLSSIDNLYNIYNRLFKTIVLNKNGIELIEEYNNSNVFIYCDPPYEQSTRTSTRYKVDMNEKMHIDFINAVNNSKSKILISGYDCELYERLNKHFVKKHFNVNTVNGKNKSKTKTETLWKNY